MKSVKDLNIHFKSKTLQDNMEGNTGRSGVSNVYLDITPKVWSTKEKSTEKLNLVKINFLFFSESLF